MGKKFEIPNVPFVESRHRGRKQKPTAIILRTTENVSAPGAALHVADYWHNSMSAFEFAGHYVVDSSTVYRTTEDHRRASDIGDHPKGAIEIMVCADFGTTPDFDVLRQTADLVVQLGLAHRIPLRLLTDRQVSKWKRFRSRRRGGYMVDDVHNVFPHVAFEYMLLERLRMRLG